MTPRLYSYCIPFDDGAAPNPFWGTCTLVICKPAIRRTARVGDWIAGTGSKYARLGDGSTRDLSGRLVYAMKVTRKLTMPEYDTFTRDELPEKIPVWTDPDRRRRLGDSIYDFSGPRVTQRPGVHGPANRDRDLSGEFALLSNHFFYFGQNAVELPPHLRPIAQNRRGHRVALNTLHANAFIRWIEGRCQEPASLQGEPLLDLFENAAGREWCAGCRAEDDEHDDEFLDGGCEGEVEVKIDLTQTEIVDAHKIAVDRYNYALVNFPENDNKFLNHLAGALGEVAVERYLNGGIADFDPAFRDPVRGREADLIVYGVGIDVKTSTWKSELLFRKKQRGGLDTKTAVVLWTRETHEPRPQDETVPGPVPTSCSVTLLAWAHATDVDQGAESGEFLVPRQVRPLSELPGALYLLVKG